MYRTKHTTLYRTTLNYTTLHNTSLRYTTLHYSTLHFNALHNTTLHYTALYLWDPNKVTYEASEGSKNNRADPCRPLLAVRPTRCTYCCVWHGDQSLVRCEWYGGDWECGIGRVQEAKAEAGIEGNKVREEWKYDRREYRKVEKWGRLCLWLMRVRWAKYLCLNQCQCLCQSKESSRLNNIKGDMRRGDSG